MEPNAHLASNRANLEHSVASEVFDVAVLTRKMVTGDEAAYRMFYEAYFSRLSRYLLVLTAGSEDAMREALQGMLKRVVRHIRVFEDEAALWSWLTVLARSAHRDERRKRRRYLAFLFRFTRHAEIEGDVLTAAQGDDRLRELLDVAVASLPRDERQLIEWKYADGRTVREIATLAMTTDKAIESRLGRVRLKLKAVILASLKNEATSR